MKKNFLSTENYSQENPALENLPVKCLERYMENFELWCRECVVVADKLTGAPVPLRLNAPQRRVAALFEERRRQGVPLRVIMLKARQWGGSTLVQAYMAWMQLVRHRSWHSLVCAHFKDAAAVIRSTYSTLLRHYPAELMEGDKKEWTLVPFEKTQGISYLPARDCRIAVATAMRPDALRGSAFLMAHLSEAAFWADGDEKAASAIIRTVGGAVPMVPESMVVIESTANGRDNYLYHEWQRATAGESDKDAVFVPWHEIEIYRKPLTDSQRETLRAGLTEKERVLVAGGVTLESIAWYRDKRREYASDEEMQSEFPGTPDEAFRASSHPEFMPCEYEQLIRDCGAQMKDEMVKDEMEPSAPPRHDRRCSRVLTIAVMSGGGSFYTGTFKRQRGVIYTLDEKEWEERDREEINREESFSFSPHSRNALMQYRRWLRDKALAAAAEVFIVAPATDGSAGGEARWLRGALERDGVRLAFDRDEQSAIEPDESLMAYMTARHREMLQRERLRERDGEAVLRAYKDYDRKTPGRFPAMMARLAATYLAADECENSESVDLLDDFVSRE